MCMCVRMYVGICIHAFMYTTACMYVCVYVYFMYGRTDGRMFVLQCT